MTKAALRTFVAALGAALPLVAHAAGTPLPLPRPGLELERTPQGSTQIFVRAAVPGGGESRTLVRQTADRVEAAATGRDPRGAAAFVTWRESGSPYPWFATSQDSGRNWSRPNTLPDEIRLRDGATRPGAPVPSPAAGFVLPADGRVFLVQFRTVGLPEWRTALADIGAEVLNYFPFNAHLVRMDAATAAAVAKLDFVQRVEPFHPWYRVHAPVREWYRTGAEDPAQAAAVRRINVLPFEWGGAALRRVASAAQALGAQVANLPGTGQILQVDVTREQLRRFVALDDVLWVDFWSAPEKDMDITRQDSGADWLETGTGWCGQGVRGEVLDAGFETTHMDFDGILLHGAVNVDSHGTSTYGIVFGNGARDGDGSAKGTGHLPCAQGIAADYDNLTDRFAHTAELKQSPYFATFQSNSWGDARTRSYESKSFEMDDIIWRLDFAILNSQSNAGNQDSRPQAWAKNIISVGAVNHYDTINTADDCWCTGASIGPAEDGRIKPDISYWYDEIFTTTTSNGYTTNFGGTSGATPQCAGVVGLMLQMWSENVWGTDPVGSTVFERRPHASTIKALAINNAQQWTFSGASADLARMKQGYGRPSVQVAKERAANSFIIDEAVALKLNDVASYDVNVLPGESELKITFIYNDPPGTTSATLHRINDLDLKVISPSGVVYNGNFGIDANNYSLPGGTKDNKNTVENVFVQNPQSGTWKVEIAVAELNQDQNLATPEADAVFALVVTGGTGQICAPPVADFTISPNPARVGQPVTFDSTVSGGAGGPYTYQWYLDGDPTLDSTAADAVFAYARPYVGAAKLRAKDVEGCNGNVEKPITVTGPDLRYDAYVNLTQVEGNSNGAVDPGEVWDVRIRLRNQGNEPALGVNAGLQVAPGNAGPLTLLAAGPLPAGDIAVGGTGATTAAFRFQVGSGFPCGNDATFSVVQITSADPANRYPDELGKVKILVGGAGDPVQFLSDGFETTTGWTLGAPGEWEITNPRGLGSAQSLPGGVKAKPDPNAAAQGTQVLGTDLTGRGVVAGNYESLVDSKALSPVLNCFNASQITLKFKRWLNVAQNDLATLEASANGTDWTTLYTNGTATVTDGVWTPVTFDVSALADSNPNFRLRFGIQSDNVLTLSGWNVDDLQFWGVTRDSCQPYARTSPGAIAGLAVDRSGSNLNLAWTADCGAGTAYGVYRGDLLTGYGSLAPEPGRCSVAGTATTVPQGAGGADFFLVVPNVGGFEGSYGAASTGADRPPAAAACFPRDQVDACAP